MGTSLSHYSLFFTLLLVIDWLQGKACNTSWNFLFLLQPLDKSGYSRVKFGPPNLFMSCSIEGTSHNQSCLFTSTSISSELESGEIVWRIPSGIKTHARIVSVVTFILPLLPTLLIVLTCIFYSDAKPCKNQKQFYSAILIFFCLCLAPRCTNFGYWEPRHYL